MVSEIGPDAAPYLLCPLSHQVDGDKEGECWVMMTVDPREDVVRRLNCDRVKGRTLVLFRN